MARGAPEDSGRHSGPDDTKRVSAALRQNLVLPTGDNLDFPSHLDLRAIVDDSQLSRIRIGKNKGNALGEYRYLRSRFCTVSNEQWFVTGAHTVFAFLWTIFLYDT
ncbi:hypothetical protein DFJ58DRAFT_843352 [Suillus subalutaceus]|uniref:uncharacterized protein n=1 Tax=Suillus subalutaceus TaxID=48586 RepID=UPI001B87745D|nr:uncharacterized protein DFJ58DRAFT_843352 [Suillus subalutaceus]KAG1846757.1 hypothetical protein DFJ58DRAFT_843352 [Suillus subalutaceus]